jgi:tetratricopeptide (TPR) repeat protein
MSEGEAAQPGSTVSSAPSLTDGGAQRAVALLIALLVAKRVAYHLSYLVRDPFALATFSDGQLYEQAARDILAHPPFGSEPFYLQGLYAYVLALPMAGTPQVVLGLLLQLVLAAFALWLFHRAATSAFGKLTGSLSTACLLAFHELAFYENKYLSVSLGVSCNVVALWVAVWFLQRRGAGAAFGAGAGAGLSALGRPNMILALPFTAAAALLVAHRERKVARVALAFGLGAALVLSAMALRNLLVIGRADVFPSHSGGIPFYIGNNPAANGRWNDAGGLLSGQVGRERLELATHLGLTAADPAELDRAVGAAMRDRALRFIREQPGAFIALEARKLWLTLGNHRFARDYDVRGEAELIGGFHALGLPFGALLGLGALGVFVLLGRAANVRGERAELTGILLIACGQLFAVLSANVLFFTSAQNRLPLCVPLAFTAGPALSALAEVVRRTPHPHFRASPLSLAVAGLLCAQAFVPRSQQTDRPSSVHYYNLAAVEEAIGRLESAAHHYQRAALRNPKQPMFHLSRARALRQLGRTQEAAAALSQLAALPDLPPALREAAAQERALLEAAPQR